MKMLVMAILSALAAAACLGQVVQRPAPFDSGGRFLEWSGKLDRDAGLFAGENGFRRALLWRADSLYVLEVYTYDGRVSRSLSPAQVDSLRSLVDVYLAGRGKSATINQEGRGTLLWSQLPLSLGWYGSSVVAIVEPERASTSSGLYCLSAAGSFFLPMQLTKGTQVSRAQANLAIGFGYLGLPVGWAVPAALGAEESRPIFSSMLVASVAGQFAGFHLSRGMSYGQSDVLLHSSFWGAAEGIMLAAALPEGDPKADISAAGLLAGTAAGSFLGWRSAGRSGISDGEAMFVTASGVAGGFSGFYAIMLAAGDEPDEIRRAVLLGAAGSSLAGLYLGKKLSRGYAFSKSDGYIMNGAVVGGNLLGMGVGFLLMPRDDEEIKIRRTMSAMALAGTAAGYYVGLRTVRQEDRKAQQPGFGLEVNPVGLLCLAAGRKGIAGPYPLLVFRF